MDAFRFDRLTRTLATSGTRRGLVRLLAALPLGAALLAFLGDHPDASAESGDHGSSHRRHRRKARHRHQTGNKEKRKGKRKGRRKGKRKGCTPKSDARTCAGRCSTVINNCDKPVDCGPCTCATGCPTCKTCNPETGLCENSANGTACNDGEICTQGDSCQNGVCQGTPVTCANPSAICCPSGTPNAGACAFDTGGCTDDTDCCSGACVASFVDMACCPVCPPGCTCAPLAIDFPACRGEGGSGTECGPLGDSCDEDGEACFADSESSQGGTCQRICGSVE